MIPSKFEAKLDLPLGLSAPDVFDVTEGPWPSDDFIISRGRDGAVISRFGDNVWDISAWLPQANSSRLIFDFWGADATPARDLLSREARWVVFSIIWLRDGAPSSVGSLTGLMPLMRLLARYADGVSCSLSDLLSDDTSLRAFGASTTLGPNAAKLGSVLTHLARIGPQLLGFEIVGDDLRKELNELTREHAAAQRQHPPIPTRLYSAILAQLSQEMSEWEAIRPEALPLLESCGSDPYYGRMRDGQQELATQEGIPLQLRPEWADVATPSVRAYLREKGEQDSAKGLSSAATQVQQVTKLVIQAFSGMRDKEALLLPFSCKETTKSNGRVHRIIQGTTTKLAKGTKRTRWVTNAEGHRAVELAQQIASVVYSVCGVSALVPNGTQGKIGEYPLFVSTNYLGLAAKAKTPPTDGLFFVGTLDLSRFIRLRARIQPLIERSDLVELEKIDQHRAWGAEERFQVGSPWVLMTHQLRRSLALYAQRSGIVTLPSLRQQLQHITEEMSRYYARGSQYASDIFGEDPPDAKHFGVEWQATQAESEACSYAVNVLLTDETLFGGHAAWVTHRVRGSDGTVAVETRAQTMRLFKQGQMHYRETLIGGCTKSGECDSPALDWLNTTCISNNFSNLVGNLTKLEQVVVEQERLVAALAPSSLMYRTEKTNLEVLTAAREKARLEQKGHSK